MATRNDKENQKLAIGIDATLSGTTPGTAVEIDTYGYNDVSLHVFTGTVTDAGTAAGITWELTESDTSGSGYSAVADADLVGLESDLAITADGDDDKWIGALGYIGAKRYLKLTPTGTTGTNAAVKAVAIMREPKIAPVSAS